jgi:hypothetical protein
MINSFSQFLVEEEKTVYFTFGRMNPPTIGHGKLLDTLAQKAGQNPYRVFLSQSQDKKDNPLQYKDKVKHVRKMFPKHARSVMVNQKVKNAMDAATALYKEGFQSMVMVVGSDRIREFDVLLTKYNGKESRHGFYNFKRIQVISAGDRDPDAQGVEGMSASKQRANAKENDFTSFAQGLPKPMSNPDAKRLFNDVRKGMGLKEAKEFKNHVQLEPVSELREAYIRDNIFEQGEQVVMTKNGIVGNIKHLGSNYLIVESNGETWRCWLGDVEKVDWVCGKCNCDPCTCESINEAKVRWKRGKYPGEIEATIAGKKYKIEKALDHNDRHKGEWKVMVWDKRDWEWETTEYGKANAKEWIMNKHGIKESVEPHPEVVKAYKKTLDAEDQAADYNHRSNKARVTRAANHLSKKIKQHHPDLDMKGKIAIRTKLQNMKEANQPEWGTPASTKKAKKITPGENNEACWDSHKQVGMKMKNGKMVPNCVPKEASQDPDIKDRPGSQPAGYHKGLTKAQKVARDRQFKKQSKMSDNNPAAYKKAPGDHEAKTKLSKHTKRYRQMFGEDNVEIAKKRIDREKQMDKRKHDRMMDRARMRDVKKINKETK